MICSFCYLICFMISFVYSILLCSCTKIQNESSVPNGLDQPAWSSALEDDDRGLLMSIWEAGEYDIWVVGGQTEKGIVLRCQAPDCASSDWAEVPLPDATPLLNWIHGIDANNVWVGGISGTLLFWNGSAWDDFSFDISEAIWGIHAQDDQVTVVGGLSRWGGDTAVVSSLQNGVFEDVPIPEVLSEVSNLFKVTATEDNTWVVGEQGTLMKCSSGCEPIATGVATDLITITADQDQVHLVGGRGTGVYAPIAHGSLGDIMQVPSGLNGVSARDGEILVAGERGYSAFLEDGELLEIPSVTLDVLHAALIDSQGRAFAVGGNLFTAEPTFHGVLLQMVMP